MKLYVMRRELRITAALLLALFAATTDKNCNLGIAR